MLAYTARRIAILIPTLVIITGIAFTIISLTPGDPVTVILGPNATQQQIDHVRQLLGLNQPVWLRYLQWLGNAVRGNFGASLISNEPVMPTLLSRLPATVELMTGGVVVALVIGVPIGVVSAVRRNSVWDALARVFALVGIGMPSFWLALIAILVFALYVPIFPPSGSDGFSSLVLPSVTLGLGLTGVIMRITRSSVLNVLDEDFIRTARAKGLAERIVIYRHALRNALLPIMTIVGLQVGFLLGGTVVIESVFSWPGIGFFTFQALMQRDYPTILASLFLFASMYLAINLIIDLLYGLVDPRIRLGGSSS